MDHALVVDRPALLRRGLRLEYATLAWNAGEVGFLFYAAAMARSVALAGFALDSCIEIFACRGNAGQFLRRFSAAARDPAEEEDEASHDVDSDMEVLPA